MKIKIGLPALMIVVICFIMCLVVGYSYAEPDNKIDKAYVKDSKVDAMKESTLQGEMKQKSNMSSSSIDTRTVSEVKSSESAGSQPIDCCSAGTCSCH